MTKGTFVYDSIDMEDNHRRGWWWGFVAGIALTVLILVACLTAGLIFDI